MTYLLTSEEIEALWEGKLKPQEVMRVENVAVLPWCGADIVEIGKKKGVVVSEDDVWEIRRVLNEYDCWMCLEVAVEETLNVEVSEGGEESESE